MTDTITMTKGETVSLSKKAPGLTKVIAAAGWDMKKGGATMDLDLAAFLLQADGKLHGKENFIYFGHKKAANGSVEAGEDNLTGEGDGDDETIKIDLTKVDSNVVRIELVAAIYQAKQKNQSLKDLDNAFIRIVNQEGNAELVRYTITDTDSSHDTFVLGELVREGAEWNFKAVGTTRSGELGGLATNYGLQVAA